MPSIITQLESNSLLSSENQKSLLESVRSLVVCTQRTDDHIIKQDGVLESATHLADIITMLGARAQEYSSLYSASSSKAKELADRVKGLRSNIGSIKLNSEAIARNMKILQEQNNTHLQTIAALHREVHELESSTSSIILEHDTLCKEVEKLRSQLQSRTASISNLVKDKIKDNTVVLQKEIESKNKRINELKEIIKIKDKDISTLKSKLTKKGAQNTELVQILKSLRSKIPQDGRGKKINSMKKAESSTTTRHRFFDGIDSELPKLQEIPKSLTLK